MICNMFVSPFSDVVSDYMMKNRVDRYQKLGFCHQMAFILSQWFGTGRFVKNKNTVTKMVSYYKNSKIKLNNAEIFVLMDKGGELPDDYDLSYVRRIFFGGKLHTRVDEYKISELRRQLPTHLKNSYSNLQLECFIFYIKKSSDAIAAQISQLILAYNIDSDTLFALVMMGYTLDGLRDILNSSIASEYGFFRITYMLLNKLKFEFRYTK